MRLLERIFLAAGEKDFASLRLHVSSGFPQRYGYIDCVEKHIAMRNLLPGGDVQC